MYFLKSSIIHLFSYMKYFRRTSGEDPRVGQWALSPFRNQKSSFFCQLAKYTENYTDPLFEHSESATELGSFNDSLYRVSSIEIFNLKVNWTKLP